MSSIGMVGATALGALVSRAAQSRSQKFKQDFEQLRQDPQSGSLTAEDSDYAALQKDLRQAGPGDTQRYAHVQSRTVRTQAHYDLTQLGQALESGNLTAARQAYSALQTDTASFAPLASDPSSVPSSASVGLSTKA